MNQIQNGNNQIIEKVKLTSFIDNIEAISFQRNIDDDRVKEIKDYLIEQKNIYNKYPFLGLITICELNKKFYCIDGQHRLLAYKNLISKDSEIDVLLDSRKLDEYKQLRDLFLKINQCVQVPDYLLYEENEKARDIIKNSVEELYIQFDMYFVKKPTSRKAYRPFIKKQDLENAIFYSNFKFKSKEKLLDYLLKVNIYLSNLDNNSFYNLLDKFKEIDYQDKKDKIFGSINKAKDKCNIPLLLGLFKKFSYIKDKSEFEKEIT